MKMTLTVNKVSHRLVIGDQPGETRPSETLAETLRDKFGLTGTKIGCDQGSCGSCTVILDGVPILSCMTLTVECDGRHVITIEGLGDKTTGELDPLQQAFIDHTAFQCGFCTPGMIMASKALLNDHPSPEEKDVKKALAGHYCRCISHYHVVDAVLEAAEKGRG